MSEFIKDFANTRFYYTPNGNCHLFVTTGKQLNNLPDGKPDCYAIKPEEMDTFALEWIEMRIKENEFGAKYKKTKEEEK